MWVLSVFGFMLIAMSLFCSVEGSEGSVRLVDGPSSDQGRVELYHDGRWGIVCDDGWDIKDADVVCRQLGYPKAMTATYVSVFGYGSGYYHMDDVHCAGNEASLASCPFNGWGTNNCADTEAAGVICQSVRLVGGPSSEQGRVEIYHGGRWAKVCDDIWDINDATVVCRQLGFPAAIMATTSSKYGNVDDDFHMDDVACVGHEATLSVCPFAGWNTENCASTEAAGVICHAVRRWSAFSAWSSCSKYCGTGTMSRSRTCSNPIIGGVECVGLATETLTCNTHACPVNGGWSAYSVLQPCTVTCGGGTLSRIRTCSNPSPANGGAYCAGSPVEVVPCNAHVCPVNGGWTLSSEWQACTSSCGGGIQSRNRTCSNPVPAHGGDNCTGSETETRPCNSQACPVNGGWSSFIVLQPCTATCGGGTMSRMRTCSNPPPANGGDHCMGSPVEVVTCNAYECPVKGGWSAYSDWQTCTSSCGGGIQSRNRTCSNPVPAHGGDNCTGSETETRPCNSQACSVNGGWSAYSDWQTCTNSCGGGIQSRSRTCSDPAPAYGGVNCSGSATTTRPCNTHACPVNGGWSSFSVLQPCTATCGGGTTSRMRTCSNPPPANGGDYCVGSMVDVVPCNTYECPVNGGWSAYSDWQMCTSSCGGGIQSRNRTCSDPAPAYGGVNCSGSATATRPCNTQACPGDAPDANVTMYLLQKKEGASLGQHDKGLAIPTVPIVVVGVLVIMAIVILVIVYRIIKKHHASEMPGRTEDFELEAVGARRSTECEANVYECVGP